MQMRTQKQQVKEKHRCTSLVLPEASDDSLSLVREEEWCREPVHDHVDEIYVPYGLWIPDAAEADQPGE